MNHVFFVITRKVFNLKRIFDFDRKALAFD